MKDEKENFDEKTVNEATTNEINDSDTVTLDSGEKISKEVWDKWGGWASWETAASRKENFKNMTSDDGLKMFAQMAENGFLEVNWLPVFYINEKGDQKILPATENLMCALYGLADPVAKKNFLARVNLTLENDDKKWKYRTIEDALADEKKNIENFKKKQKLEPGLTEKEIHFSDRPQGWEASDFDENVRWTYTVTFEDNDPTKGPVIIALKKAVWEKYRGKNIKVKNYNLI